tara:strand:- start:5718 stop:6173 length:456 start_codon:yes stop_codon:yes gene_type:complete
VPLLQSTLSASLSEFFSVFGDPESAQAYAEVSACASQWGDILVSYASAMTPPVVASAGKDVFVTAFTASLSAASGTDLAILSPALTAFAVALVPTMLPAFVGIPPVTPLSLSSIGTTTVAGAAQSISSDIHTWFSTGTAIQVSSGSTVNWS